MIEVILLSFFCAVLGAAIVLAMRNLIDALAKRNEVGFEHVDKDVMLERCKRYYETLNTPHLVGQHKTFIYKPPTVLAPGSVLFARSYPGDVIIPVTGYYHVTMMLLDNTPESKTLKYEEGDIIRVCIVTYVGQTVDWLLSNTEAGMEGLPGAV